MMSSGRRPLAHGARRAAGRRTNSGPAPAWRGAAPARSIKRAPLWILRPRASPSKPSHRHQRRGASARSRGARSRRSTALAPQANDAPERDEAPRRAPASATPARPPEQLNPQEVCDLGRVRAELVARVDGAVIGMGDTARRNNARRGAHVSSHLTGRPWTLSAPCPLDRSQLAPRPGRHRIG